MTTPITAPLVALGVEREFQDTIARAASPVADVDFIDVSQVTALLVDRRAVAGFIVALSADRAADIQVAVRQAREARPTTPIIACAAPRECAGDLIVRAVRSGADHITLYGFDEIARAVERVFGAAMESPICADAAYRALPWIPSPAQPLISCCTMGAASRLTVTMVAEALRVSDRTLYRLMRGLHLPTPEATIGWCRLFVATHMIATTHQQVERVAEALGFGSGSQLRNMFKRYTGHTLAAMHDAEPVPRLAQLYCIAAVRNMSSS